MSMRHRAMRDTSLPKWEKQAIARPLFNCQPCLHKNLNCWLAADSEDMGQNATDSPSEDRNTT